MSTVYNFSHPDRTWTCIGTIFSGAPYFMDSNHQSYAYVRLPFAPPGDMYNIEKDFNGSNIIIPTLMKFYWSIPADGFEPSFSAPITATRLEDETGYTGRFLYDT